MLKKWFFGLLAGLSMGFVYGLAQQGSTLPGLKSGKIRMIEVSAISDDSLPQNIIVEMPASISLHRSGDVFVCDAKAADIKRFDATGKFLGIIGRRGQGPGEFSSPTIVHVSERHLVVWDQATKQLSHLTIEGQFLKGVRFDQEIEGYPVQIRSLPDDRFIIETERFNNQSQQYPQECLIRLYSSKMEFIKTLYAKPVFRFKRIFDPGYAEIHQPFNPRVYWDVTPDGKVVIGYAEKYEIEIYDPDKGRLLSFSGKYVPVKVTEGDKEGHFFQMTVTFIKDGRKTTKKGAPPYVISNTLFPGNKPAFDGIKVDSDGSIWIHVYREDREEEKRTFDAFSDRGEYIGKTEILPPGEFPYSGTTIRDGCFWKIEIDEDGIFRIVKYKIS
ncbi:MAG: 6-bladed beta-propeller [Planctomycetes bacterium]|nr:6-bladed beta-propeller [Planctomycetota bacterium]